jgi:hypothetical protein
MVQSRKTPEEVVVPEDTLRLKRIETQLCLMTKVFMDGVDRCRFAEPIYCSCTPRLRCGADGERLGHDNSLGQQPPLPR